MQPLVLIRPQFPEALRYQVSLKVDRNSKSSFDKWPNYVCIVKCVKNIKMNVYYCFITNCKCDHRRLAHTEEYRGRTWFGAAFSVSHVNTRPGNCRRSSHPAADSFPSPRSSLLPLFWYHRAPESTFFSIETARTEAHMMRKGAVKKRFKKMKRSRVTHYHNLLISEHITQDCKTHTRHDVTAAGLARH